LAEWETGLGLLSTRCGSKSAIHSASLVRAYLHRWRGRDWRICFQFAQNLYD